MSNKTIGKNMMLFTSAFRGAKTFNLAPVSLDCPYVECLFDPESKILAVITKTMKQSYHMIPKVDDSGDPVRLKVTRRESGKNIKEQRVLIDTFSEFYISNKNEIEDFITTFAINANNFDYTEHIESTVDASNNLLHLPVEEKDMVKEPLIKTAK
tara:strand:+ start:17569 stop:18033 length:465 start_codon:yes stop_codon:yes gene_type:complete